MGGIMKNLISFIIMIFVVTILSSCGNNTTESKMKSYFKDNFDDSTVSYVRTYPSNEVFNEKYNALSHTRTYKASLSDGKLKLEWDEYFVLDFRTEETTFYMISQKNIVLFLNLDSDNGVISYTDDYTIYGQDKLNHSLAGDRQTRGTVIGTLSIKDGEYKGAISKAPNPNTYLPPETTFHIVVGNLIDFWRQYVSIYEECPIPSLTELGLIYTDEYGDPVDF